MSDKFLFIDTETTKFRKSGDLIQEGQARVCQLSLILTDSQNNMIGEFHSLIKPEGWSISEGANNVHGLTDENCQINGVDWRKAMMIFDSFYETSSKVVAHNEDFDRAMINIEAAYYNKSTIMFPLYMKNVARPWLCTMKSNKHIAGGKNPSLNACLQHYCKRSLGDQAHNSRHDAQACRDIFFAMRGVS